MSKKKKLVCGVGIMDADYRVQEKITIVDEDGKKKEKLVWICPFYRKWKSMIERCYSEKAPLKYPTYIGCTICDEWLTFSNFRLWMKSQDWEGNDIDKDILFPGNKIYSPDTCVFIDHRTNSFLLECSASRGKYMIGVCWDKTKKKFVAQCSNGVGKRGHIGYFNTEIEAHKAWLKRKQEVALKLASEQTDPRVAKALIGRYENYEAQEKEA